MKNFKEAAKKRLKGSSELVVILLLVAAAVVFGALYTTQMKPIVNDAVNQTGTKIESIFADATGNAGA